MYASTLALRLFVVWAIAFPVLGNGRYRQKFAPKKRGLWVGLEHQNPKKHQLKHDTKITKISTRKFSKV
jgi:hypothetical protein